jgi:hypothetical protein
MQREPVDENPTLGKVGVNDLANITQRIHSSDMQSPSQQFSSIKSTGISGSGHSPKMYDVLVHLILTVSVSILTVKPIPILHLPLLLLCNPLSLIQCLIRTSL